MHRVRASLLGLAFLGGLTAGLNALLLGTERAWIGISAPATGIASFGASGRTTCSDYRFTTSRPRSAGLAFLAIYLALFFLTFFYTWLNPQPGTDA